MNYFFSQCLSVTHSCEQFLLHPQRVLYWPSQKILFAADVHAGKEHVFARHGIAIPGGISESTLQCLFLLANESGAERLIVLGDFMHNIPHHSESWLGELSTLLDKYPTLHVDIVAGNHDKKAGRKITDSRLKWHNSPLLINGLVLHHEPCSDPRGYVLSGHLHPVYRIGNSRRGAVRAPVFWFRERCAVLPAFGEFTGGVIIKPDGKNDKLYMTGPDCVVEIPAKAQRRNRG